jgi:hypothetical protein
MQSGHINELQTIKRDPVLAADPWLGSNISEQTDTDAPRHCSICDVSFARTPGP